MKTKGVFKEIPNQFLLPSPQLTKTLESSLFTDILLFELKSPTFLALLFLDFAAEILRAEFSANRDFSSSAGVTLPWVTAPEGTNGIWF